MGLKEQGNFLAWVHSPQGFDESGEFGGVVGVVVDVVSASGACAAVEPPRNPAKARDRFADRGRGHAHAVGQRRRSHRILHIMKPREACLRRNLLTVHNQNKMLQTF